MSSIPKACDQDPAVVERLREQLLKQVAVIAREWASYPDKTPREIADGVAFTILAHIDGCTPFQPQIHLSAEGIPFHDETTGELHDAYYKYSDLVGPSVNRN